MSRPSWGTVALGSELRGTLFSPPLSTLPALVMDVFSAHRGPLRLCTSEGVSFPTLPPLPVIWGLAASLLSTTPLPDEGIVDMSAGRAVRPHSDLASFLSYVQRTQQAPRGPLRQQSTTFRGTLYEYVTREALLAAFQSQGLAPLAAVGRAGDGGVDLWGQWKGRQSTFGVAVQCKAQFSKVPARLWRELAGVHVQLEARCRAELGLGRRSSLLMGLASPSPMTKLGLEAFNALRVPLIHCLVAETQAVVGRGGSFECEVNSTNLRAVCVNMDARELFRQADIRLPV